MHSFIGILISKMNFHCFQLVHWFGSWKTNSPPWCQAIEHINLSICWEPRKTAPPFRRWICILRSWAFSPRSRSSARAQRWIPQVATSKTSGAPQPHPAARSAHLNCLTKPDMRNRRCLPAWGRSYRNIGHAHQNFSVPSFNKSFKCGDTLLDARYQASGDRNQTHMHR